MSGLAALYERRGAPAGEARITAMLDRLRHRGPDRRAHRADGSIALAQCLLETTPEDALDRQPLRALGADRWIVADVRLDNRSELLRLLGEPAAEVPDAEIILRAYERWGEGCPARLVGDFAFALWDGERRRLVCARDPLGVRPLYYHHDAASFRCASEMAALFADERVARRPHRASMALFLASLYTERDETLYDGVHALPPGHTLIVTSTSIRCEAHWKPDPHRSLSHLGDDQQTERFREVFAEAVRCRLRARGPVAAQVSGGLDSSSVACEAERLRREGRADPASTSAPLVLTRLAFPGLPCDERPYSDAVAAHLGLSMTTIYPLDEPGVCRLEQRRPDLYFHPTTGMLDPMLADLRDRGIRTLLTGAGGDLLMQPTGYEMARHLRAGRLRAALADLSEPLSRAAVRRGAIQSLWAFAPSTAARLQGLRSPARVRWPWLSAEAARRVGAHLVQEGDETRRLHPDLVTAELCREITHGVGTLLPAALDDRTAAAHAVDFRHPFFDVRLVELLLALPQEQRYAGDGGKRVLRRALGPTLPALVRERRDKAEFTSYVRRTFLADQRGALQRLLRASLLEEHGLVDGGAVGRLLAEAPEAQNPLALANLVSMELWLRASFQPRFPSTSRERHEDQHDPA